MRHGGAGGSSAGPHLVPEALVAGQSGPKLRDDPAEAAGGAGGPPRGVGRAGGGEGGAAAGGGGGIPPCEFDLKEMGPVSLEQDHCGSLWKQSVLGKEWQSECRFHVFAPHL